MFTNALRLVFCVIVVSRISRAENLGNSLTEEDQSAWRDVNDPLSWDGKKNSCFYDDRRLMDCENKLAQLSTTSDRPAPADLTLRHVVRQIAESLNINLNGEYSVSTEAYVSLSAHDIRVLKVFVEGSQDSRIASQREQVRNIMSGMFAEIIDSRPWFVVMIQKYMSVLIIVNLIVLPPAIFVVCQRFYTLRQWFVIIMVAMFFIAYGFTYYRQYQQIIARRIVASIENEKSEGGDSCTPKGTLDELADTVLGLIRIKGKSKCLKKYEDVLIEPIVEINPLEVFGEVLTAFFLSPLKIAGTSLNKFFNDFFTDTPIHLTLLKMLLLFLFLFYALGYRFRTLLWTLEPSYPPVATVQPQPVVQSLEAGESVAVLKKAPESISLPQPTTSASALALEGKAAESDSDSEAEVHVETVPDEWPTSSFSREPHPPPSYILELDWYHSDLKHKNSEQLLEDRAVGSYLLRKCDSKPGFFVLSVRGRARTRHYIIEFQVESLICGRFRFEKLEMLVKYFSKRPIGFEEPDADLRLTHSIKRPADMKA